MEVTGPAPVKVNLAKTTPEAGAINEPEAGLSVAKVTVTGPVAVAVAVTSPVAQETPVVELYPAVEVQPAGRFVEVTVLVHGWPVVEL